MGFLSTLFTALAVVAAVACASPSSPTATPNPAQQPTPTATPIPSPEGFFLHVLEPTDESVVSTAQVTVRGRTTADAVVTVDGQTVDVEADGSFQTTATLQEGPNVLEVLASDFEGNEETVVLALIYIP